MARKRAKSLVRGMAFASRPLNNGNKGHVDAIPGAFPRRHERARTGAEYSPLGERKEPRPRRQENAAYSSLEKFCGIPPAAVNRNCMRKCKI